MSLFERLKGLPLIPEERRERPRPSGLSERLTGLSGEVSRTRLKESMPTLGERLSSLPVSEKQTPPRERSPTLGERLSPLSGFRDSPDPPPPPSLPALGERLLPLSGFSQREVEEIPKEAPLSQRLAVVQQAMAPEESVIVEFGEWLPDQPDLSNPGALTAQNVIPAINSYRPMPNLAAQTNALTGRCLGAIALRDESGNTYVYAGDSTKLYENAADTFVDESKVGDYATATGDVWEFSQFGQNVIATNFTDPVQTIAIGGGGAGLFADLITSTNKPKAKHVAAIGNFLVLGNTSDVTDGHVPNRVWWSGFGDQTDFDPDATTQSDYEDGPEGGAVQKIVGGVEYGIIFHERSIVRMTYVGPPTIFDFKPMSRGKGTPIPNSVVSHGRMIFYVSEEGFQLFDGSISNPIGANKVDRTFWDQFDVNNDDRMSAAIDPINKIVAWAFPGEGNLAGAPNKIFFYNWVDGKWSEVLLDTEIVVKSATQGYTLDGLDAISTNIDTGFTESFDSDVWKGGALRFAAFDTTHKLGYFTGTNLAAQVDTREVQLFSGRRGLVTSVRPLVSASGASILSEVVLTDPFTTTRNSTTVTVNDPSHGLAVRDTANFSGASEVAGITIDGDYDVQSVIDGDNYTITHSEAAGENMMRYSDAFDNSEWTKEGVTINANAINDVDGNLFADKLEEISGGFSHRVTDAIRDGASAYSWTIGEDIIVRVHVKAGERDELFLDISDAVFGSGTNAIYDLTAKTATPGATATATIEELDDGWFEITLGGTALLSGLSSVWITMRKNDSSGYTGTTGEGLYVGRVSIEQASSAGPYVKTVGATWKSPTTGSGSVTRTSTPATITGSLAGRTSQVDTVSFLPSVKINRDGYCSLRKNARYHRARINVAAETDWEHIQGVEMNASPMGDK